MLRLLFPILLLAFCACQKDRVIDDDAARLRGEYPVQTYIINNDTLFSAGKINKIGVEDFKVIVSRKSADSLSLGYSWTNKSKQSSVYFRQLRLSGKDGQYQLAISSAAPHFYEGTIFQGVYTERTSLAGLGFVLLPENYPLKDISDPTGGSIKIIASKQ